MREKPTRGCLWGALLQLAVIPALDGEAPVVKSFDATGRLTFSEVPGADFYQVEWSTSLAAGSWSSSPPGIQMIPASGSGDRTVFVGTNLPRCFYRVAASFGAAVDIVSDFATDADGWISVAYPFRYHYDSPDTGGPVPWDGGHGDPAGSVRIGDLFGETGISAPAKFIGNKIAYYGGTLSYDILIRYTDNNNYPAVVLNGGTFSLYYDTPTPPLDEWEHRTIPLTETGWKISDQDTPATAEQFKAALANLTGLYIYTEWYTGPDDTNVDNVILSPPAS